MASKIGILILAAGNSSRFGSCKLLAKYRGEALISYSLNAAKKLAAGHVHVVTGAWHQELQQENDRSGLLEGINIIHHQYWQQGMGSSIAKGMESISADYDALMIMLADQPLISVLEYQQLLAALQLGSQKERNISCAVYANKRGVPAVFNRHCFRDLKLLDGSQGAKSLLYNPKYKLVESSLVAAITDIDYQEELMSLNVEI